MIGILGGMGPRATLEFYRLLLDLIGPTTHDSEYPSVVISSRTNLPSRTLAFSGFDTPNLLFNLYGGMNSLKSAGANFVVCPCNSAHYFLRQFKENYPLPLLDIVDITIQECINNHISKALLLGAEIPMKSNLYETDRLEIIKPKLQHQEFVRNIIDSLKSGTINTMMFNDILAFKEYYGIASIIFACTELCLLGNQDELKEEGIIDSTLLLAKAALEKNNEYRY